MELNRFFDLMEGVRQKAAAEAIFGPPTQVENKTVIPVGRVNYGFGLGFGRGTAPVSEPAEAEGDQAPGGTGSGGGGGAKVTVQPVAVLEVTPEATTVKPILDEDRISRTAILVGAWSVFWLAKTLIKIFGRDR